MYLRNASSLYRLNNLERLTSKNINEAVERLSSGKRINHAKDDVGNLGVSVRMTSKNQEQAKTVENFKQAKSFLETTEGVADSITNQMQRMRELAVQYQNGTYSNQDKEIIEKEFVQIYQSIQNMVQKATYNNKPIFYNGRSLESNGVNGPNVNIPYIPDQTALTIEAKVFLSPSTNWNYIFDSRDSGFAGGFWFARMEDGELAFGGEAYSGPVYTPPLDTNKWYDVAVSASQATGTSIYVNGELVASTPEATPFYKMGSNIKIASRFPNTESWNGKIDDIKVFDVAKSQQEIQHDINSTLTGSEPNLVGYWDFNDGGSIAYDRSPNGYDGIITGLTPAEGAPNRESVNGFSFPMYDMSSFQGIDISHDDILEQLDQDLEKVLRLKSEIGTNLNRLDFRSEYLGSSQIETAHSLSRITDADIAQTSSSLLKEQIKQQSITSMYQKEFSHKEMFLSTLLQG